MTSVRDAERIVLKAVFKSTDGLHLYTLHTRFLITPGLLTSVIKSLEGKGLVRRENDRVFITGTGRQYGYNARFDLFASTAKPWRDVPERCKAPIRSIYSPYVPFKDGVHWSLLPKSARKK